MTSDSALFQTAPGGGRVPLLEAKLVHQYNHRWARYGVDGQLRDATPGELADTCFQPRPRYWVAQAEVEARLGAVEWQRRWLLVSRMIAPATNERTWLATVAPRVGIGNSAAVWLLAEGQPPTLWAALLANLNSLVADYVVRQKVGGSNLNFFLVKQFAVLPPAAYQADDLAFVVPRVLELSYTAWDLQPFAQDLGYGGSPFPWDEERRAILRAELDAYYAHRYGLSRDELRYVLDPRDVYGPDFPGETFRVLKERELKQFGEYRTRRLVLEAWDRLVVPCAGMPGRDSVRPSTGSG